MPTPPILLVVASQSEAVAAMAAFGVAAPGRVEEWLTQRLDGRFEMLVTGVGKVNAAAGVAGYLERFNPAAVISAGIAGVLPGAGVEMLGVVAGSASVYADEGVETPTGFIDCAAMGFGLGPFEGSAIEADAGLLERMRRVADVVGRIATVSTCSGTDERARAVLERTGAVCEAMEGAAVGHVVARHGGARGSARIPFCELRVISNTTGDRGKQRWDLKGALARLTGVLGRARGELSAG
jgi:futalosine hydrolase